MKHPLCPIRIIGAAILLVPLSHQPVRAQQAFAIGSGGVAGLWSANCLRCHGDRGQGGGAGTRSLLDDEWLEPADAAGEDRGAFAQNKKDAAALGAPVPPGSHRALFNSVKFGHPESGMVGFGATLNDAEIWALVAYIHELRAIDARKRGAGPKESGGVYESKRHRYKVETVIDSGLSVPWSVDFVPVMRAGEAAAGGAKADAALAGAMLVTERAGKLRAFKGGVLGEPIAGTPAVRNRGQGGLMDVAVHPDYAKNGWIYLAYSERLDQDGRNTGNTKIVRGRIRGGAWVDQETIFAAKPEHYQRTDLHFGCRIVFDRPDDASGRRHIFWSQGERFVMDMAQDLSRPNGKIFRLWDDGTVPDDNPFIGTKDAYPAIWSYGHRNPQGLCLDLNGNLWDTEHGPRGGDELNRIERGRNYGWPRVTFGIDYSGAPFRVPWPDVAGITDDIAMPAYVWMPSIGACGLDCARGEAFPEWKGDLFAGGLSGTNVDRIRVDPGGRVLEREELVYNQGRVRDVVCGPLPDGFIYVVLNDPDKIVRLTPAR